MNTDSNVNIHAADNAKVKRNRILRGGLGLLLALVLLISSMPTKEVYAASFNPVVDTITSSSDSRITSMITAINLQSFKSTTSAKVQNYISYFIYDSTYAAIGGSAWPYTNENGYVSSVTDGTYTISGINGSGCFAYSKFVMNVIYGTTGEVLAEGESAGKITASGLETFLRTYAQAGEQLRLGNIHSVTFISCTDSGFYYLDYWSGYIRLHYTTFAVFAASCNSATSSVQLWLYNANTATNDVSLQTSGSTEPEDGTASTLTISPTSYPSGQVVYGNYFNLKGTISSNYTITKATGTIYTESGTAVQTRTATPNACTLSIVDSALNYLAFGSLEPGSYYLEYTATDSSGKTVVWTSDVFYVVESDSAKSTLSINPVNYPTGSMVAQSFTLTGTVTSNYTLTSVTGYIYNSNGDTLYAALVTGINSTTFNIADSKIDNSLPFGSLDVGSYYLVYEASDSSGASASWTSDVFYIVSSTSSSSSSTGTSTATSTLSISPTAYPTGNISNSAYNLKGTITSSYSITSVTAQIVAADGTVAQTVTDTPNSTSYNFSSKINPNLKFGSLSSGYYYLYVAAEDAGGNSATWKSDIFAVSTSSSTVKLYADLTDSSAWYYWQAYSLTQVGIFAGITSGSYTYFYPNNTMTRAQAVSLFYRLYSDDFGTPSTSGSNPFTDVASGSWYYTAVTWAYQTGLVSGTSDTTFEPEREITRQELARIICSYLETYYNTSSNSKDWLASYTDGSSVASWAQDSVNWCIANGIFSSTSTTSLIFEPTTAVTRGQGAVLFYNIIANFG